jgi:hypothetical protein
MYFGLIELKDHCFFQSVGLQKFFLCRQQQDKLPSPFRRLADTQQKLTQTLLFFFKPVPLVR